MAIKMHKNWKDGQEEVQTRKGKVYIAAPGTQAPDDPLTQEEIQLQRTNKIQQEQLARSAASLVIQSVFRGWATRKRYVLIVTALLSIRTHEDGSIDPSGLPSVKDLKQQVGCLLLILRKN